jgi:diaminohydroxyphosphoribosylaminopyrimidine deaminase/5-amino-6-(5-phosphoribosylamino)uracil reductase
MASLEDREYMEEACRMAFHNMGVSSPNPSVGALLVHDSRVISRGVTEPAGKRHAEVVALEDAPENERKGATLYVSLEPCSFHGRTPPCTEAIINAGVKRVVIPLLDPNPRVSGKGVRDLEDAGVEVTFLGEMSQFAADLYRSFKKYILRERPWIIHKSALTLDGRTAADSGHSRWISNETSRLLAHRLRARVDAVLVGKNTFIQDRPLLSARPDEFSREAHITLAAVTPRGRDNFFLHSLFEEDFPLKRQPLRVVMGLPAHFDPELPFFHDSNYLFYERKQIFGEMVARDSSLARQVERVNYRLLDVSREEFSRAVLSDLGGRGFMSVLLEGGKTLAGDLFDLGEIDQFCYILAPMIAGSGFPVMQASPTDSMNSALRLQDITTASLDGNMLVNGYAEVYNFEMM